MKVNTLFRMNCEQCQHKDVCIYRKDMEAIGENLLDQISDSIVRGGTHYLCHTPFTFKVEVQCKNYPIVKEVQWL